VKRIQKVDASKVTQSMATASAGSIVQLELEGHHYELLDCSRLLHKSSY